MATRTPPAEPLVVIFGSTGTGKSDLAVELATRFNGEIINADAMQMYEGLPIITNKISAEERRGITHHLIGNIGREEETWMVGVFRREATRLVREIRSRGKLPIVVGGTHYYINGLLFEDTLISESTDSKDQFLKQTEDGKYLIPILNAPTEEILERLREVDPVMADRWHPNDRKKILRSLEIYLTTGRRASDIYEEQRRQREQAKASSPEAHCKTSWETLMLWVYSQPSVLNDRLDRRVDKMVNGGLMAEISEMHEYLRTRYASGHSVDRTRGIWQSIGFKEFEPYLTATSQKAANADECGQLEHLKQAALERMKISTRQYAKAQVRWITHKTLPLIRRTQALDWLFLLDSTDITRWREDVLDQGVELTRRFVAGQPLPPPSKLSDTAREVLSSKLENSNKHETLCKKTCEICKTTVVTEEAWQQHIKGRAHKRVVFRAGRRALVTEPRPTALAVLDSDEPDSPDYSGLEFGINGNT